MVSRNGKTSRVHLFGLFKRVGSTYALIYSVGYPYTIAIFSDYKYFFCNVITSYVVALFVLGDGIVSVKSICCK